MEPLRRLGRSCSRAGFVLACAALTAAIALGSIATTLAAAELELPAGFTHVVSVPGAPDDPDARDLILKAAAEAGVTIGVIVPVARATTTSTDVFVTGAVSDGWLSYDPAGGYSGLIPWTRTEIRPLSELPDDRLASTYAITGREGEARTVRERLIDSGFDVRPVAAAPSAIQLIASGEAPAGIGFAAVWMLSVLGLLHDLRRRRESRAARLRFGAHRVRLWATESARLLCLCAGTQIAVFAAIWALQLGRLAPRWPISGFSLAAVCVVGTACALGCALGIEAVLLRHVSLAAITLRRAPGAASFATLGAVLVACAGLGGFGAGMAAHAAPEPAAARALGEVSARAGDAQTLALRSTADEHDFTELPTAVEPVVRTAAQAHDLLVASVVNLGNTPGCAVDDPEHCMLLTNTAYLTATGIVDSASDLLPRDDERPVLALAENLRPRAASLSGIWSRALGASIDVARGCGDPACPGTATSIDLEARFAPTGWAVPLLPGAADGLGASSTFATSPALLILPSDAGAAFDPVLAAGVFAGETAFGPGADLGPWLRAAGVADRVNGPYVAAAGWEAQIAGSVHFTIVRGAGLCVAGIVALVAAGVSGAAWGRDRARRTLLLIVRGRSRAEVAGPPLALLLALLALGLAVGAIAARADSASLMPAEVETWAPAVAAAVCCAGMGILSLGMAAIAAGRATEAARAAELRTL